MKKSLSLMVCLLATLFVGACGTQVDNQGIGNVEGASSVAGTSSANDVISSSNLGDYHVVIDSCRLSVDYNGASIVIVKYLFTNNSEEATSFMVSISDTVYQNGVELDYGYLVEDYSSDNQMKSIKPGITLEVEAAYKLDDTTADIEVEVSELFSWTSSKKVTKTFTIK